MQTRIAGFHVDDEGQWVAELECGHTQHMRHDPPWQVRPWVLSPEGRATMLGTGIDCRTCPGDPAPHRGEVRIATSGAGRLGDRAIAGKP